MSSGRLSQRAADQTLSAAGHVAHSAKLGSRNQGCFAALIARVPLHCAAHSTARSHNVRWRQLSNGTWSNNRPSTARRRDNSRLRCVFVDPVHSRQNRFNRSDWPWNSVGQIKPGVSRRCGASSPRSIKPEHPLVRQHWRQATHRLGALLAPGAQRRCQVSPCIISAPSSGDLPAWILVPAKSKPWASTGRP